MANHKRENTPSSNINVLKLNDNDIVQKDIEKKCFSLWFLPNHKSEWYIHEDHLDAFNFSIHVTFLGKKITEGGTRLKPMWSSPTMGVTAKFTNITKDLGYFLSVLFSVLLLRRKVDNVNILRTDGLKIKGLINLRNQTNDMTKCNICIYGIESGVTNIALSSLRHRFAIKARIKTQTNKHTKQ